MVKIKISETNPSLYFELGGVDYKRGLYVPFYSSLERNFSGEINEKKVKIGLKHYSNESVIQEPISISSYINSNDEAYGGFDELMVELIPLITKETGETDESKIDLCSLTEDEIVCIANAIAELDKGHVKYYITEEATGKYKLHIYEADNYEQIMTLTKDSSGKRFFTGTAPYRITAEEDFPLDGLEDNTHYYAVEWNTGDTQKTHRAKTIGYGMGTIEKGFDFGTLEGKEFLFNISRKISETPIIPETINIEDITGGLDYKIKTNSGLYESPYFEEDRVEITDFPSTASSITFTVKPKEGNNFIPGLYLQVQQADTAVLDAVLMTDPPQEEIEITVPHPGYGLNYQFYLSVDYSSGLVTRSTVRSNGDSDSISGISGDGGEIIPPQDSETDEPPLDNGRG